MALQVAAHPRPPGRVGDDARVNPGEKHLILLLDIPSQEEADRVAAEVGGPWMREHIVPLLADGTQRAVGVVVASAPS